MTTPKKKSSSPTSNKKPPQKTYPKSDKSPPNSEAKKSLKKKYKKRLSKRLWIPLFIASALIGCSTYLAIQLTAPVMKPSTLLTISKGSSAKQISAQLASQGMIRNKLIFESLLKLKNNDRILQAGNLIIPKNPSMHQIISILTHPKHHQILIKVTIPEGFDTYKIVQRLKAKDLIISTQNVTHYLLKEASSKFSDEFPFLKENPTPSLEGYLYPDTYHFSQHTPLDVIIRTMLTQFQTKALPLLTPPLPHSLTAHQILTLASIVEKEAHHKIEMPTIASVYLNRLRKKMKLQADPTVLYALENTSKPRVYFKDLKTDSPYNTYFYPNLPPGPIASPGVDAITAVLAPKTTPYLFFVANPKTRTHIFTKTYQDHSKTIKTLRSPSTPSQ